jgi:hypothetical protein
MTDPELKQILEHIDATLAWGSRLQQAQRPVPVSPSGPLRPTPITPEYWRN